MKMQTYTDSVAPKNVPQTEPLPGKSMIKNAAGGYVFKVDDMKRLDRFLILGSEGGTFYLSEKKLTKDNAQNVLKLIAQDGQAVVQRIVEISKSGRAHKNDPAIFALGLCMKFGDLATKQAAQVAVPQVCRIGTHLFHLAEVVNSIGGWGRGTKNAFKNFYLNQDSESLGDQLVKYQQRDGWSHRDVLRLVHLKPKHKYQNLAFKWVAKKTTADDLSDRNMPDAIKGFEKAKAAKNANEIVDLIEKYGLPREAIPTEYLNSLDVWQALLTSGEGMPMMAMVRNLGKMTSIGLLKALCQETKFVVSRLDDLDRLKKSRLHPMHLLLALRTYSTGHGEKGSLTWTPVQQIVEALERAFYNSFSTVEATGKNFFLGVDVSGSMTFPINGTSISNAEAAAVMAMLAKRTEKNSVVMGFADQIRDLGITANDSLTRVCEKVQLSNFGSTDCGAAISYAIKHKLDVDVFCIYTDNDTYAGGRHVTDLLKEYRQRFNKNAKVVVCAFSSTNCSIADPNDPGMLDVVGFDAAIPQLINGFVRE